MAALQHVRSSSSVFSVLRQVYLLRKQHFSISLGLQEKQRTRDRRITTRFARVEPPVSRSTKQTVASQPVVDEVEEQSSCVGTIPFNPTVVNSLLQNMENDLPLPNMPDPFSKDYRRCYLCTNDIHVNYKNVRLLSQFVSPYTGRIYGRAITGLCIPMQRHVAGTIKKSRATGFMPVILKDPKYLNDPQPFNPMAKQSR